MGMEVEERREEYAYVLDFMASGKSFSNRSEPITQLMGEEKFTLLEATIKPGANLSLGERVYIGKDERDKILLIKSRIGYDELTQTGKNELSNVILKIIKANEKRFVDVFNNAGPLNIRQHALELLPGIGKKHLEAILKARNERKFESLTDISERVQLLQDPAKLITDRIITELRGDERSYMFTKPYRKRTDFRY
jgi:putative nucleotide binding protein